MTIKNKPKRCECGCGEYANPGRRFINGHNRRNVILSDVTRNKMRKSTNKRWEDPLIHEKASESANKRWENPLEREKAREKAIKQWENPLTREKAKIKTKNNMIKRWKDPVIRELIIEGMIKAWENPALREKVRKIQNKRWEDLSEREKVRESVNKRWENPLERKKASERTIKQFSIEESRERASAINQNQDYDAGEWTGYADGNRPHLIPSPHCIHLNSWFEGCNQHHIMTGVIINIPVDLHKSMWHRMPHDEQKDKNMKEINKLAFNYLLGEL